MTTPRRFVRTFKPQFAPLVENGVKRQTIRPTPKVMPRAGDLFDARQWTGLPYRSKQRKLGAWPIVQVLPVRITDVGICLDEFYLGLDTELLFARADGFRSWPEMRDWFTAVHGLPFEGIVIYWAPIPVPSSPSVLSVVKSDSVSGS